MQKRGILLAVCSKNDEETAKQGFEHPDSVLKLEHISCFKANWEPKHKNILEIAKDLNLGVDSFVFVDDNPAERAIVEAQISGIAVPDIGTEVSRFAAIIEAGRYFEPVSLSQEDISRAGLYQAELGQSLFGGQICQLRRVPGFTRDVGRDSEVQAALPGKDRAADQQDQSVQSDYAALHAGRDGSNLPG